MFWQGRATVTQCRSNYARHEGYMQQMIICENSWELTEQPTPFWGPWSSPTKAALRRFNRCMEVLSRLSLLLANLHCSHSSSFITIPRFPIPYIPRTSITQSDHHFSLTPANAAPAFPGFLPWSVQGAFYSCPSERVTILTHPGHRKAGRTRGLGGPAIYTRLKGWEALSRGVRPGASHVYVIHPYRKASSNTGGKPYSPSR